jgi:hypothetical protein
MFLEPWPVKDHGSREGRGESSDIRACDAETPFSLNLPWFALTCFDLPGLLQDPDKVPASSARLLEQPA